MYPSDSPQQQEAVWEVAAVDAFQWGYDPVHYGVPGRSPHSDAKRGFASVSQAGLTTNISAACSATESGVIDHLEVYEQNSKLGTIRSNGFKMLYNSCVISPQREAMRQTLMALLASLSTGDIPYAKQTYMAVHGM